MADYGAKETNPVSRDYHNEPTEGFVDWTDSNLVKIERLRLLSDPGFPAWDVSYCIGRLKNGRKVNVVLPFDQLPRRKMREAIVAHARRDGVYAKRLGIFEALSTLV